MQFHNHNIHVVVVTLLLLLLLLLLFLLLLFVVVIYKQSGQVERLETALERERQYTGHLLEQVCQ